MENNNQHKRYQWYLQFDEITWQTSYADECPPFVNEENKEVWRRYLNKVIKNHLKEEAMKSPEFKDVELRIREEKFLRIQWDEKQKRMREVEHYRRQMDRPKIDFVPRGLSVNYEEEYAKFFMQEVTFKPKDNEDFMYQLRLLERWPKKSIPQILAKNRPDAAYAIAKGLCEHLPLLISRDDIAELIGEYKSRIGKLVLASYTALVETVKAWNNETMRQQVCRFILLHSKEYRNFRGLEKKLLVLVPAAPFTGETVAVEREMSEEEEREARRIALQKERKEKERIEAEKEARSVIPLNEDYETRIFNSRNIGWNCDLIWQLMLEENRKIERMIAKGEYMDAALKFMQMTKSMCRHFVMDEHYNYFDDMYSPEYAVNDILRVFHGLAAEGKLPEDVKEYLHKAWKEIEDTECYKDYGMPRKNFETI